MKAWKRGVVVLLGLVVLGLGIGLVIPRSSEGMSLDPASAGQASVPAEGPQVGKAARALSGSKPGQAEAAKAAASKYKEVIAEVEWGSEPSQLGRERPQEANPEAPMSLAVTPLGDIMVLDQVNGRIVRYGPDGKVLGTMPVTQQTPQDITVAKDGTVLVLDRLRDKTVAIIDPYTEELRGELPLKGPGIPEPGLVTGTFVEGDSVYVEREHGALVRIGDLSGKADLERPELPGRPTRDGRSYLHARISDAQSGRILINFIDRETGTLRFAREYRLKFEILYITLLDSDRSGVVYLAVAGQMPMGKANPATVPGMRLYCLEPLEGKVMGQAELLYSAMPEETFRDLVVLDEGGVIYQHRTESGASIRRADCR
jgi:hypothetical protein